MLTINRVMHWWHHLPMARFPYCGEPLKRFSVTLSTATLPDGYLFNQWTNMVPRANFVHLLFHKSNLIGMTVVTAQIHFTARLDGSQQNPPMSVPATGTGSFTLSSDLSRLSWTISYQGLSGSLTADGYFHVADSGRNGPVVKNIALSGDPASNTISGVWTSTDATQLLTPALVDSLLTGRAYVNFHTSANPDGEIRGQVNLATGVHFTANLDGAQQNPPVTTNARETSAFILNPARTEIRWYITYRNLSGPLTAGGHFHVSCNCPLGIMPETKRSWL